MKSFPFGIEPSCEPLPDGAVVVAVEKTALAGRAVGLSLRADSGYRLYVQRDSPIAARCAGIESAIAMQAAVRPRLVSSIPGA